MKCQICEEPDDAFCSCSRSEPPAQRLVLALGERRDKARADVKRLEQTLAGVERALDRARAKVEIAEEMFAVVQRQNSVLNEPGSDNAGEKAP